MRGTGVIAFFQRRQGDVVLTCVFGLRLEPLMDERGVVDWRDTAAAWDGDSFRMDTLLADGPVWYALRTQGG